MSLVRNKSGQEICFEIALAFMLDDLREQVETLHPKTKQLFISLYEMLHESELGEDWNLSLPEPLYR